MFAHAQSPVRIGIAGGGTDLPVWTKENTGYCLSLAIASYTHAVAITRPDGQVVASYRQRDVGPSATEIANGLIRESALAHEWVDGFEVHTLSELSSKGSGLGVSSSIAVSLSACFTRLAMMREGIRTEPKWSDGGEMRFRHGVAQSAWEVEIERLLRPIGRQDHMAAAHGGLKLYGFKGKDAWVEKYFDEKDANWLCEHLLLVELPDGHDSRSILSGVKSIEMLKPAADAVQFAINAIAEKSVIRLATALAYGQDSKEKIPGALTPTLEKTLTAVRDVTGVIGCKIAGAGGGGHILVAVDKLDCAERISFETGLRVFTVKPDFHGVRSEGWA